MAPSPSLSAALLRLVVKVLQLAVTEEAAYKVRGGESLLAGRDDRNRHEGCVRAAKRKMVVEDIGRVGGPVKKPARAAFCGWARYKDTWTDFPRAVETSVRVGLKRSM